MAVRQQWSTATHILAWGPSQVAGGRHHAPVRSREPCACVFVLVLGGSSLTTSPSTSVRTRSPISGEMSLPNCCRVLRKRFSLLSCRAPQAGGRCCVDSEAEHEVAGPLLKPLGVDGAPCTAVGEWLPPFITAGVERSRHSGYVEWPCHSVDGDGSD